MPVLGHVPPYQIKRLGVEDGLSNNYVVSIAQDRHECLWIATEFGLNRFDGHTFKVFKKEGDGLGGNELNTLYYDEDSDQLWIGTQRDGISVIDCFTQHVVEMPVLEDLMTKDVTHLTAASDGGIWIIHYHAGVEHYDKHTRTLTTYADADISDLPSKNWCGLDDGAGRLYIGHAYDGMSILDLQTRKVRRFLHDANQPGSLPGNEVRAIYMDHNRNIWVGTNGGLALFNSATEQFLTFRHRPNVPHSLPSNHVFDIREMDDHTLWVSTDMGGVSILNLQNTAFMHPDSVHFQHILATNNSRGLSSPNPRCLYQDNYRNIWIGNYRGGVDFISHEQSLFHTFFYATNHSPLTASKPIWGVCMDPEQGLWVGGENEVLLLNRQQILRSVSLNPYTANPHSYVNVIFRDRSDRLWLGMYNDRLLQLNPYTGQISCLDERLKEYVHVFYEEPGKKMWIGTENGIYSYTDEGLVLEEDINHQLVDKMVHGILRDRQGKLWIGTFGRGIWIFDSNNQLIEKMEVDNGFCSNAINHLYMDDKGGVWIATRNGLAYIKNTASPTQFIHYGVKEKLENLHVKAVQQDLEGHIWISTNGGISMLDASKGTFVNYNYHDGIPMGDFVNAAGAKATDGTIYFTSQNGLCCFQPNVLLTRREVAPVRIVECKGFNRLNESREEEYDIPMADNGIELPYDRNSFRIKFAVPNYAQRQQVEYAYMIEGLEDAWYNTQGEHQVTFRNLPIGHYRFQVKSRLRNQPWEEKQIASLSIQITPPWWLTWYAKLLYGCLILLAFYALLRFYKRRLDLESSLELERKKGQNEQELNNERLRFYTNITHELRTPLTLILGPLEDLLQDKELQPVYVNKIHIIHSSAVRLLNLINQLLEFRKTETQNRKLVVAKRDLGALIMETGLRFKELNSNERVSVHVHVDTEETLLYFDAEMIVTILNNLLSNALKYTPKGEIDLTLRSVSQAGMRYAEIEVKDTGYGIDPQSLPHIFERYYQVESEHQVAGSGIGLALVKSLVDLHEGCLQVSSTLGEGSRFTVRLLAGNTYPYAQHLEDKASLESSSEISLSETEENDDSRPVILVVEDNADIRHYLRTSLEAEYMVCEAADGQQGWDLAQSKIPDMIVSDIMMPVMDGLALCKAVKEDVRTSHIPVILLTAKDSIQDKEEGYESGADSYMTKPFSAKLLSSRIHNILAIRKKWAQQIQSPERKEVKEQVMDAPVKLNKLDQDFLTKLTQVIQENIEEEKMDVAFIADRMNMSHSTLYRKIKGLTGLSINEFIRKTRIRQSAYLLREKGYNVSEAAYMTGFYNRAYFRQCFKEEYGVTPSEYMKQAE